MIRELIGQGFVPIPEKPLSAENGQDYVQTNIIPVEISIDTFSNNTYLNFKGESLELLAGGDTLETVQQRIRKIMIHRMVMYSEAKWDPPPLNAELEMEEIRRYFHQKVHAPFCP